MGWYWLIYQMFNFRFPANLKHGVRMRSSGSSILNTTRLGWTWTINRTRSGGKSWLFLNLIEEKEIKNTPDYIQIYCQDQKSNIGKHC